MLRLGQIVVQCINCPCTTWTWDFGSGFRRYSGPARWDWLVNRMACHPPCVEGAGTKVDTTLENQKNSKTGFVVVHNNIGSWVCISRTSRKTAGSNIKGVLALNPIGRGSGCPRIGCPRHVHCVWPSGQFLRTMLICSEDCSLMSVCVFCPCSWPDFLYPVFSFWFRSLAAVCWSRFFHLRPRGLPTALQDQREKSKSYTVWCRNVLQTGVHFFNMWISRRGRRMVSFVFGTFWLPHVLRSSSCHNSEPFFISYQARWLRTRGSKANLLLDPPRPSIRGTNIILRCFFLFASQQEKTLFSDLFSSALPSVRTVGNLMSKFASVKSKTRRN